MNPQLLTCQQKFHEFEPIIGFCLNTECSEQPKFCTQCIFICHLTHKEDCKSLYSIKSLLKLSADSIDRLLKKMLCDWKYIYELFQNIINFLQIEQVQIQDLDRAFENEEYQSLSDKMESLKTYYYLTQKIDQLCSLNFYYDLDELHSFCQSLNSLSKPELKIRNENDLINIPNQKEQKYNEINIQEPLEFQKKSENIEALINKSCVLIEKGRFQEALEFSNQVLGLDPNNKIALNNKDLILFKMILDKKRNQLKFYQEALTCLDDAIKLYPNDPFALMNKGNTLNKLDRKQEAKQLILQAIQEDSSSQIFPSHLGDLKSLILDLNRQSLLQINQNIIDSLGGIQEIQQQKSQNYYNPLSRKLETKSSELGFNYFSQDENESYYHDQEINLEGNLEPDGSYNTIEQSSEFINAQPNQYRENVDDRNDEICESLNQYNNVFS